jgi:hypothetical protein
MPKVQIVWTDQSKFLNRLQDTMNVKLEKIMNERDQVLTVTVSPGVDSNYLGTIVYQTEIRYTKEYEGS